MKKKFLAILLSVLLLGVSSVYATQAPSIGSRGGDIENTDASTKCSSGEYLSGDDTCVDVIEETELDTESKLETQITDMANIIQATEIDTAAKLDAIVADENLIVETEIDTEAKLVAIVSDLATIMQNSDINTFSKIQTLVANKTLVNEEDAATWDSLQTFSAGVTIATAQNLLIGSTQWNSGDGIDGTKVTDADLGDIGVSSGVWSVENDSHDHATTITGKAANVSDADFGDVTVSSGAWGVEDDSHAHTSTSLTLASTNLTDTANIMYVDAFDSFTALQTLISDKTLVNEEDAATWDAVQTFSVASLFNAHVVISGENADGYTRIAHDDANGLPTISADTMLVLDRIGGVGKRNVALSLIADATNGLSILNFGDQADENVGYILYDHSAEVWQFATNSVINQWTMVGSDTIFDIKDRGTADSDGKSFTFEAADAGTGGTGNHDGGDIILIPGALAGTGSAGNLRLKGSVILGIGTKNDGFVIRDTAELQTIGSAQTTIDSITLLDENTYHVEVDVAGVQSDGTDRASYHLAGTVYRTGAGSATLQGSVTSLHTQESNASLDATFTVSGNDVRVSVTGIAAETWEWVAVLSYLNMSN